MIHCWAIGKKVVRVTHRATHRAVHKVRHHYHSPAVKIVAPAIVCVSTGAGFAPWLVSAPPPLAAQGTPPNASFSSAAAVPIGGGMLVAFPSGTAAIATTIPPEMIEFPAELASVNVNEWVPGVTENLIGAPSSTASQSS